MFKFFSTALLATAALCGFSQTIIPAKTIVPVRIPQDITNKTQKPGTSIALTVGENVVVNGVTVIAANTEATGKVTIATKTDLRLDILETKAVDGTPVRLADCWIYTSIDQNPNGKYPLLRKGTEKNCNTAIDIKLSK